MARLLILQLTVTSAATTLTWATARYLAVSAHWRANLAGNPRSRPMLSRPIMRR